MPYSESKTYVLIHGAWHNQSCWKYVKPLLIEAGHKVLSLDLRPRGR